MFGGRCRYALYRTLYSSFSSFNDVYKKRRRHKSYINLCWRSQCKWWYDRYGKWFRPFVRSCMCVCVCVCVCVWSTVFVSQPNLLNSTDSKQVWYVNVFLSVDLNPLKNVAYDDYVPRKLTFFLNFRLLIMKKIIDRLKSRFIFLKV